MATQIPAATRHILAARSGSVCEVCGAARATEASHRRPRGMGGTSVTERHGPSWLVHVCHDDHVQIESQRIWAQGLGLLLGPNQEAARTPVYLTTVYGTGWWLLDDEGLYSHAQPLSGS